MHIWYRIGASIPTLAPLVFWAAFVWLAPLREHPQLILAAAIGLAAWAFDLTVRWHGTRLMGWIVEKMATTEGGAVVCAHQLAALMRHRRRFHVRIHGRVDGPYLAEEVEVVHTLGNGREQPSLVVSEASGDVHLVLPTFVLLDVSPDGLLFQAEGMLVMIPDHGADSCLSCCHGERGLEVA